MSRKKPENEKWLLMTEYGGVVKEIIKRMEAMQRHNIYTVFNDFVEWCAYSIRQPVDLAADSSVADRLKHLESKYTPEETKAMGAMFGVLIEGMQTEAEAGTYGDIIGDVFQALQVNNPHTGQFFTPRNIAYMMAKMVCGEKCAPAIERDGYMNMMEPSSGSGIMIVSLAAAMREAGFNPTSQLVVHAVDVDLRCVCMTYINTALYGLPAVVYYGDALNMANIHDIWYTPAYVLDLWIWRDKTLRQNRADATAENVIEAEKPEEVKTNAEAQPTDAGGAGENGSRAPRALEKARTHRKRNADEVQQLSLSDMWQ